MATLGYGRPLFILAFDHRWDPLAAFLANVLARDDAAAQIADNYIHFVNVYTGQRVHS
jgi:hypothetical protein